MFSALGNIILGKPRQAENADTRQDIRRHDPEQEQRRKKEGSAQDSPFADMQDDATVSIEALRLFLENFLKGLQNENATENTGAQYAMPSAALAAPIPVQNAQAINAYQSGALTAAKPAPTPAAAPIENAEPAASLSSDEIRTIYKLMDDLQDLSERGIHYLHIERSDTFLHSLESAVAKIRL